MESGTDVRLAVRQQASRSEVLDAAAEAFIERGYTATSIDDVADRLGCTKGRVYHYFRTKGELFLGVHRTALDMAIDAIQPTVDSDSAPIEKLTAMAAAHARLMLEESSYMRLAVQHVEMSLVLEGRTPHQSFLDVFALRQQYESYFERVIADGMRSGDFRKGNANLMAKAALGSLNWIGVWYRPNAQGKLKVDAAQIVEEFTRFVVTGLLPEK